MKPGGGGKADMDGFVDIDDAVCEVTRERLSLWLAHELGEFKKPRTGDWDNRVDLVEFFVWSIRDAPSSSAGAGKVPCDDCLSEVSRDELFETMLACRSSRKEPRSPKGRGS